MTMSELGSATNINDQQQSDHDGHYTDEFESDGSLHQEPARSSGRNTKASTTHQSWRHNMMSSNFRTSSMASYSKEDISHRLLSAKRLKMNELRNEIQSLLMRIKDLEDENRMLKRVQIRQERELVMYDSKKGELPDIFKSHTLEVHSLQNQLRQAKGKNVEFEKNLKSRDRKLNRQQEELRKMQKLVEEQGLQEKRDLMLKIDSLEDTIKQKDSLILNIKQQKEVAAKSHKRELATKQSQLKEMHKMIAELRNQNEKQANFLKEKDKELLKWAMQGPQRRLSSRMPMLQMISSPAFTSNAITNGDTNGFQENDISLPLLESALQSLKKINEPSPAINHSKNTVKHIDLSTATLITSNENEETWDGASHKNSPTRDKREMAPMQKQDSSKSIEKKVALSHQFPETPDKLINERFSSAEPVPLVTNQSHSPKTELLQGKKNDLLAKLKAIDNNSSQMGTANGIGEGNGAFSSIRNGSKNENLVFGSYQPSFRISPKDSRASSASVDPILRSNSSRSVKKSDLMTTLFGNRQNETSNTDVAKSDLGNNGDSKKKNSLPWA